MTLDHLGAFASGLPADSPCQFNPFISLDACAADTLLVESTGDAGTIFQYGSSHMTVMGAMAQAVTGENWDTVFRSRLLVPLGLDDPEIRYVTLPQQQVGMINPLVAGGLVIGIDDYMPLLALLFHRGQRDGETFIDADLVGRLFENPYAEADIGVSPFEIYGYDYRYSFGSWLMCDGPVEECDVVSSPGAFGFTPWVHDREGEPRYYAVLAMESDGPGGAEFSVNLTHDLMPLIAEYLEG